MTKHRYTGALVIVECACCHMDFGVTPRFQEDRRRDHQGFTCPAGHSNVYRGPSEEERLRQERDRLKQNAAYLEDQIAAERDKKNVAYHQARAFKGQVTKIKNRVGKGVCPCCNRHFTNLERHMASQHGGYHKEEATV